MLWHAIMTKCCPQCLSQNHPQHFFPKKKKQRKEGKEAYHLNVSEQQPKNM